MNEKTKKYLVRSFDSNAACEEWLNNSADFLKPISIADTNRYVTVLVENLLHGAITVGATTEID